METDKPAITYLADRVIGPEKQQVYSLSPPKTKRAPPERNVDTSYN
jgi:hypothetical protein